MQKRWQWSLLGLILLSALSLRLNGLDWDAYEHYHPDERYIAWVATTVDWPAEWATAWRPTDSSFNPFYWAPDADTDGIIVPQDQRRSFAYGHVPLYLGVIATRLLEWSGPALARFLPDQWVLVRDVFNAGNLIEFDHIAAVGRALAALFDTGTILLLFLLGRRLFGPAVGLLGAAFLSVSVLHVQLAHFFTVDPFLTFFVTAALTALVFALPASFAERPAPRVGLLILGAVLIGLAIGSKFAAVLLVLPLAAAVRLRRGRGWWAALALTITTVVLVFAATNPFALLDWGCEARTPAVRLFGTLTIPEFDWGSCYLRNVVIQRNMVSGAADFGFTRQYAGTLPYLYPIEMQLRWGQGWLLGLLAFAGFGWAAGRGLVALWQRAAAPRAAATGRFAPLRARLYERMPFSVRRAAVHPGELVLLAWTVPYFLTTGGFTVKFMRYLQPLMPFLLLYGAALLWQLRPRGARLAAATAVLGFTALYALAFTNLYRQPHPWVAASTWIHENVAPGSVLAIEEWDEPLPSSLMVDGTYRRGGVYRQNVLTWLSAPDGGDDLAKLEENLVSVAQADYLVIASNRIYGVVPRQPERYPLSSRFHAPLFAGELGYELTFVAARSPRLLGVDFWPDPFGWAGVAPPAELDSLLGPRLDGGRFDESFTVYDQPLVMIWKNTGRFTPAQLQARLSGNP